MGIRAIIWPTRYALTHGIINPTQNRADNPFIRLSGAQHIATGLSFLSLLYLDENRALGVLMVITLFPGIADMLVGLDSLPEVGQRKVEAEREKEQKKVDAARGAAYAHGIVACVCAATGAWMLMSL